MATNTLNPQTALKPIKTGRILPVGVAAIVVACVVNVIAAMLLRSAFGVPAEFPALQPPAIIIVTVLGVGAAVIAFALVNRFARNPVRTYLIVSAVALVLSFIPNIMIALNPNPAIPGNHPNAPFALMMLHVTSAIVAVGMLTTLTREKSE
jgi:hypothetical protein